ncbi:hypothetical protein D039_2764B, partial [Vibrio parahaemolyticus EKP-028]
NKPTPIALIFKYFVFFETVSKTLCVNRVLTCWETV